jgi:hypothetical protein
MSCGDEPPETTVAECWPTVQGGLRQYQFTFPILLDHGRKANKLFAVEGTPKTFIYDRDGRMVAQSIDMRTEHQLLEMLDCAAIR